jgi:hypothetical protein
MPAHPQENWRQRQGVDGENAAAKLRQYCHGADKKQGEEDRKNEPPLPRKLESSNCRVPHDGSATVAAVRRTNSQGSAIREARSLLSAAQCRKYLPRREKPMVAVKKD